MVDATGKEITVGDYIVYCTCAGSSSAELRWGIVTRVSDKQLFFIGVKSWPWQKTLQKECALVNTPLIIFEDQVPNACLELLVTIPADKFVPC